MSELQRDIVDKVSNILHREFSGNKTKIKKFQGRINFACPYCGDSHSNDWKKRANIYWRDLSFQCFNGDCKKHTNVIGFLKDHNEKFKDIRKFEECLDIIKTSEIKKTSTLEFAFFKILEEQAVEISKIEKHFGLLKIENSKFATNYLKSRLLYGKREYMRYSEREKKLFIFNIAGDPSKCIGFQTRNFKSNSTKYLSKNIEALKSDLKIPYSVPENLKSDISTLSLYFGILRCDFSKDVTLFEGPLDSLLMKNSISISGLSKDITYFDSSRFRYLFDNDKDGKREMDRLIRSRKRVFLWKKIIEDLKLPEDEIKDFNDLIIELWNSNKKEEYFRLSEYFSDDPMDIFYV